MSSKKPGPTISNRISTLDWTSISADLDARGAATIGPLLTAPECHALAALYDSDADFRSRIVMARHGFGSGEYKYFAYPLPALVSDLRTALYAHLAPVASTWMERMGSSTRFPEKHGDFLKRCHAAEQARPTPLLLRYDPGDYNCLHQDLYGPTVFPIQVVFLLSEPKVDFTGGEFVLVEQRPRMQSRPEVFALRQGEAVIFAVNERPVSGTRGSYRVKMRHGVSRIRSGRRHTLGVIFHDAA
ncbi:MAG: 2OG-Fe(II) oxygenase [Hyphomicrobiaceae bacterium]